ncbi:hypothetical protein RFI_04786, partial [Reticulomyxa filosa]
NSHDKNEKYGMLELIQDFALVASTVAGKKKLGDKAKKSDAHWTWSCNEMYQYEIETEQKKSYYCNPSSSSASLSASSSPSLCLYGGCIYMNELYQVVRVTYMGYSYQPHDNEFASVCTKCFSSLWLRLCVDMTSTVSVCGFRTLCSHRDRHNFFHFNRYTSVHKKNKHIMTTRTATVSAAGTSLIDDDDNDDDDNDDDHDDTKREPITAGKKSPYVVIDVEEEAGGMFPELPELPKPKPKWTELCSELWQVLHTFVSEYVVFFYPNVDSITRDQALMDAWRTCPQARHRDLDRALVVYSVTEFLFDCIITKQLLLKFLLQRIVQYHDQNQVNIWNLRVGDHTKREYLNMYCILHMICQAQWGHYQQCQNDHLITLVTAPILQHYVNLIFFCCTFL